MMIAKPAVIVLKTFITRAPFTCGKETKASRVISQVLVNLEVQDMNRIGTDTKTDNIFTYILLMQYSTSVALPNEVTALVQCYAQYKR